ncbi:MAG: DnaJ domain-containing protein [Ahrensia sp.]|nr:DnaJ domain-containing protein [Ahrensia sp.]
MNTLLLLIGVLGFASLAANYFINAQPAHIAKIVRLAGPLLLGTIGLVLSVAGRVGIGGPMMMFAVILIARSRKNNRVTKSASQQSTVRSAMLEMMLDHDTGSMNGIVLAGKYEGMALDDMDDASLLSLASEIASDDESTQLLEAYLDRRMPDWRDHVEADARARRTGPAQSGAMTEQEAYQILGLELGASAAEIRKAHRGLMQRVHPDVGGSAFLAQRINEAKDFLMRTHKDKS